MMHLHIPRFLPWMVLALLLVAGVSYLSPQQFPVTLYKLSMVTVAAVFAYWIDRSMYKDSAQPRMDPEMPRDLYSAARLVSRGMIYLGTVLGITLGL